MTGADGGLLNAEMGWYAGATVEAGVGCSLQGRIDEMSRGRLS